MKKKDLNDYLSGLYALSPQFSASLQNSIRMQAYKKGQVLNHTGDIPGIWFIKSGLSKGVYFDQDGKEHITRFWQQGEIMFLAAGSYPSAPTANRIVFLENSLIDSLSTSSMVFMYHTFTEVPKLSAKIILIDRNQGELRSYLSALPSQLGYGAFQHLFPSRRLLLQDIASYLEISPGRLSEIRRIIN